MPPSPREPPIRVHPFLVVPACRCGSEIRRSLVTHIVGSKENRNESAEEQPVPRGSREYLEKALVSLLAPAEIVEHEGQSADLRDIDDIGIRQAIVQGIEVVAVVAGKSKFLAKLLVHPVVVRPRGAIESAYREPLRLQRLKVFGENLAPPVLCDRPPCMSRHGNSYWSSS